MRCANLTRVGGLGRRGRLCCTIDSRRATGVDVGAVEMPNKQTGSPWSYQIDGKQQERRG